MNAAQRGFRALIMGPPGSGKGNISTRIAQKFGALHISTGDILRSHIQHRTDIGKKAAWYIKDGHLVPNYLLSEIVNRALEKAGDHNYILDGYPRNIAQAKNLDETFNMDIAINIDMPMAAIINKIKNRLVHPESGRVYNEGALAPKVPGRDDITGEKLIKRPDDKPSVIMARLQTYVKETMPLLRHYSKQNIMYNILVRRHENIWPLVKSLMRKRWNRRHVRRFQPENHIELVCNR